MTDIVLVPVTGGSNLSAINSNFDKIEEAINTDVLHLKGGNNVMKQDLDLNGHQLLNHETDLNDPDSLINVGDADARYYNVSGDALAGNMNAAGNKILNLPVANAPHEPMRKNEVDAANAAQDAITAANNSKTIRTPEAIPALGNAASRADKLLSFDNSGNPVAIAAANQSATDLELRLANTSDPTKGADLVGYSGRSVFDRLRDTIYSTDVANNEAAFRAFTSAGNVVAHIVGDISLTSALTIGSNTTLIGKHGSRLLPPASPIAMVSARGTEPSVFTALTVNALRGATTFTSLVSLNVGDWIEFRSDALLPPPNTQVVKNGNLRKVVLKSGNIYTLDRPLDYDFLTTDNAVYGVATVLENITIRNVQTNREDFTNITSISYDFLYCANLIIEDCTAIGSKFPFGPDFSPRSGIKINNCVNVSIIRPTLRHQAWYGVEILGMTDNVVIDTPYGYDCRHTVSVNWSGPFGQPIDVTTRDGISEKSSLSGFDCHDNGLNVLFENCKSYYSGDDGFQLRAPNSKAIGCYSYGSVNDGFAGIEGATGLIFEDCTAENNGRNGFNLGYEGGTLINCNGYNNASSGAVMLGGKVSGGKWTDNNFGFDCGGDFSVGTPQYHLEIENIDAPFSADQPRLLFFRGAQARETELVTLRDSKIIGYGANVCIAQGYGSIPNAPVFSGNILFQHTAAQPTSGTLTLVAGTLAVNTTSLIVTNPGAGTALATTPEIRVSMMVPGGTVGAPFVQNLSNGTAFRITSTSATDTSKYKWELFY